MRAGVLDAEDWRILEDGRSTLKRWRAGWAASPRGPFHHSARVEALARAGLMERLPDASGHAICWTNVEGVRALAERLRRSA